MLKLPSLIASLKYSIPTSVSVLKRNVISTSGSGKSYFDSNRCLRNFSSSYSRFSSFNTIKFDKNTKINDTNSRSKDSFRRFTIFVNNGVPLRDMDKSEKLEVFKQFQRLRHDIRAGRLTDEEVIKWFEDNVLHEMPFHDWHQFKQGVIDQKRFLEILLLGNPFEADPLNESYYMYGRLQYKSPRDEHWSRNTGAPNSPYSHWKFRVGDEVPLRVNFNALIKEKLIEERGNETFLKVSGLIYARKFCELERLEMTYAALREDQQANPEVKKDFMQKMYKVIDSISDEGETGLKEFDRQVKYMAQVLEHRVNDTTSDQENEVADVLSRAIDANVSKMHVFQKLSAIFAIKYLHRNFLMTNRQYSDLSIRFWPQKPYAPPFVSVINNIDENKAYFWKVHIEEAEKVVKYIDEIIAKARPMSPVPSGDDGTFVQSDMLSMEGVYPIVTEKERIMMYDIFTLTTRKNTELYIKEETIVEINDLFVKQFMSKKEIEDYKNSQRDFEYATDSIANRMRLVAMEVEYRSLEHQTWLMADHLRTMQATANHETLPLPKEYSSVPYKFGLLPEHRRPFGRSDHQRRRTTFFEGELMNMDEQAVVKKGIAQAGVNFDKFISQPGVSVDDVEIEKIRQKETAMIAFGIGKHKKLLSNDKKEFGSSLEDWLDIEREVFHNYFKNVREKKTEAKDLLRIIYGREKKDRKDVKLGRRSGTWAGKWLQRIYRNVFYLVCILGAIFSLQWWYDWVWEWYDSLVVDEAHLFYSTMKNTFELVLANPELMNHFEGIEPVYQEETLRHSTLPYSAPNGPIGLIMTYPLLGANGKKAVVTVQAYGIPHRRQMWSLAPIQVDLMNGKTLIIPIEKHIIDGLGVTLDIIEQMVNNGESAPLFGLANLSGPQPMTVEEQAREAQERGEQLN